MSQIIPLIENAVAGAKVQNLPDAEVCDLIRAIIDDGEQEYFTEEAARIVNRSPATLKLWRVKGTGPTYRKDASGRVTYKKKWLTAFNSRGIIEGSDLTESP